MSTMAELFARDPEKHTEADLDAIIEHYRKSRITFNVTPAKTTAAKKEKVDPASINLNLDELDL